MRLIRLSRSSPSTYSMVRKCSPSASAMSYMRHTHWCVTWRARRTSLRKLASQTGFVAIDGLRNFSATVWPSVRSSARYTTPIPSVPSCDTMR